MTISEKLEAALRKKNPEWICAYNGERDEVRKWLIDNIPDATSHGCFSAKDSQERWVWRMALRSHEKLVLFNRPQDAVLFQMVWG